MSEQYRYRRFQVTFHGNVANSEMNFRASQQSLEYHSKKLPEIDDNIKRRLSARIYIVTSKYVIFLTKHSQAVTHTSRN